MQLNGESIGESGWCTDESMKENYFFQSLIKLE